MSAIHHSTFNSTVSYTDLVHVFVYLYKLCTSNSSFGNQLAEKHHLSNTNVISKTFRRSDWRCSVKKLFLKVSQNSQKKQPCRSLSFLLKLQASRFQTSMPSVKKDANTGVFLSILRNFMNSFFYRTRPVATSVFQRFPVLLQNIGKEWREFRISNQVEYLRWHFSAKRVNSLIHL